MKKLLIAALLLGASIANGQALTFTLETSTTDGRTVIPKLTWSTTPAAASCSASGASDWTGSKAASGTATLAATNATRTYTLACQWPGVSLVALAWSAPSTNTDGTPVTNLAGFRIQYGSSASALDQSVYLQDPAARTWTSPALAPGNWYFGVRAVNALGLESALSNVASKTLTAGASQSPALGLAVRFPNAPVLTVE